MSLILSGTDGLSDVDGSAATPAIRGTDSNTGIFFPAADTIAFAEGGVEVARFNASGNLGIGTSSLNATYAPKLQVESAASDGTGGVFVSSYMPTVTLADYSAGAAYGQIRQDGNNLQFIADVGDVASNSYMTWCMDGPSFEKMRLDVNGNVGIGTSSPSIRLDVSTGADGNIAAFRGASSAGLSIVTGTFAGTALSAKVTHTSGNRNIGIGTPSGTGVLFFETGGTERARIDSSGNLLVGTTSALFSTGNGFKVLSNGLVGIVAATASGDAYNYFNSTAGVYRFYVSSAGTINATSTTITAISDQRLKENVQDLDVGLDKIMALKPRKFDWKTGKGRDIKGDRGWIAQEFEQVFPDMIDQWKDPAPEGEEPYKAVRADLIPVLVKAIQEQQVLIQEIKAELAALKGAA